jgi:hypothetical protein
LVLGVAAAVPIQAQQASQSNPQEATVEALTRRLEEVEKRADEWRTRDSVFHFAGFADAGYADRSGGENGFDLASFNPIFHYQYQDRILLEAEFETVIGQDGETALEMEYSSVDVVLNDNAVLVAGKFLSPIGFFQQNFHPSWINRLPSAPVGFGHEGAAPATELGVQLRGGFALAKDRLWTYAVFVGNGPELTAEAGRLSVVEARGFARDADRSKVLGGRVSLIPLTGLEIGVSGAQGKAAVTRSDEQDITNDPKRTYQALGADVGWKWGKSWDFRGEYVRQKLGSAAASLAPEAATWKAWYLQAAYLWPDTPLELVARYGQFRSPDAAMEQDQAALGINYRLTASAIAKFGYEFNDGAAGEDTDGNRWLLQLAYGF